MKKAYLKPKQTFEIKNVYNIFKKYIYIPYNLVTMKIRFHCKDSTFNNFSHISLFYTLMQ